MGKSKRRRRSAANQRPSGSQEEHEAEPDETDRPRGTPRASRHSRWRALSLIGVHLFIAAHLVHWKWAGTTLTPLEPSEVMQTFSQGLVNAGALLFAAALLSTLVFGRYFCGWGCHILALQDFCSWLLARMGVRPRTFKSRALVFAPLLAAIFLFVLPTVTRVAMGAASPEFRPHLYTDDFLARFPDWPIALVTLAVCGFGIVYLLGNKAFCTYACPYGGLFGLLDPLAPVRVRVTDACDGCGHCTATCTSNVRVHEEVRLHQMVVDPGCMRCTDCISVCPKDALYVGFGKPAIAKGPPRAEPRPLRAAYSMREEWALAALFLVSVVVLRKLYDAVPFLLALALAAISAHLLLSVWRMRGHERAHYGRLLLVRDGAATRAGRGLAVLALAWVLFLAHSGWIQFLTLTGGARMGTAVAELDSTRAQGPGVDREQAAAAEASAATALQEIEGALALLSHADHYGLYSPANLLGLLAGGHARLGQHAQAETYFERAAAVSPDYAFAHVELARYAEQRGDAGARLRALYAAVAGDPEWPGAHEDLVRALSEAGQLGQAQSALEALLERRPSSPDIRLTYGILLANRGELTRALEETQRVIAHHPDHIVAHFNLALLYANQQRFVEAQSSCVRLLELQPESAKIETFCTRVDEALAQQREAAES